MATNKRPGHTILHHRLPPLLHHWSWTPRGRLLLTLCLGFRFVVSYLMFLRRSKHWSLFKRIHRSSKETYYCRAGLCGYFLFLLVASSDPSRVYTYAMLMVGRFIQYCISCTSYTTCYTIRHKWSSWSATCRYKRMTDRCDLGARVY